MQVPPLRTEKFTAGQWAPKFGRHLKSCNYNCSGKFARALALSLTVLFSGSKYLSGENNRNMVLVSVFLMFHSDH